jgi:hypothetical protein
MASARTAFSPDVRAGAFRLPAAARPNGGRGGGAAARDQPARLSLRLFNGRDFLLKPTIVLRQSRRGRGRFRGKGRHSPFDHTNRETQKVEKGDKTKEI